MKLIDFDQKFFEYAQGWLAMRPNMTEKQIDEAYNQIMLDWLNAPAKWLDGETPGTYFSKFSDPIELVGMVEKYVSDGIGVPEPLYNRITSMGEEAAPALTYAFSKKKNPEELRATVLGMLMEIGSQQPVPACVDLVCSAKEYSELSEMAVQYLAQNGENAVPQLLDRYPNAPEHAQTLILDVVCNFSGDERIYTYVVDKLLNDPERRALYASYLAKLGDARAIEPMTRLIGMSDIGYLDYIELRNAIESLGGDAGEERAFDGDPDYEAMRNM